MNILLFEDNLLWSSRLMKTLTALGYAPQVVTQVPETTDAEMAIVNLGSPTLGACVKELNARGIHVIGHAGHKEKDLLALGKEVGCDTLATNSELTFKIEALLARLRANK